MGKLINMSLKYVVARILKKMRSGATSVSEKEGDGAGWHSWDPHPWKHPWLTAENLRAVKNFSRNFLDRERANTETCDCSKYRFAAVGNIANNLYVRVVALRRAGLRTSVFLHPQDRFAMGYPQWEEFDGAILDGETNFDLLRARGTAFPDVDDIHQIDECIDWYSRLSNFVGFIRITDLRDYLPYMSFMSTMRALQSYDAILTTQAPYLAYLANRPYVACQFGGDIWFEAARGDTLGQLMRKSFASARIFLVSNPWSFAHARRYGFRHMIYLPLILDETVYCPGRGSSRSDWIAKSGGDFFVLMTSRLDEKYKGSSIALEGFARFAYRYPGARLVVIGWGRDQVENQKRVDELGLGDRVIWLPLSGKARLRDYLRSADCLIDQFVLGYFGGTGLEAMACGLPVIGRLERQQYEALCDTGAPPVLQAETPGEVAAWLDNLANDADTRRCLAAEHRQWFMDNHSAQRWLPDYCAVLVATARKLRASFRGTPLRKELSMEEHQYHQDGLNAAPPFPQYRW